MERRKQIRALILDAISDGYEDFDAILERVLERASAGEMLSVPDPAKIFSGLAMAVADGYAKACRFESDHWLEVREDLRFDSLDDIWFCRTPEGARLPVACAVQQSQD